MDMDLFPAQLLKGALFLLPAQLEKGARFLFPAQEENGARLPGMGAVLVIVAYL